MAISSLFTKAKSFGPLAVIGAAAAITIKLLTTKTALNEEDFKVDAEEDISLVDFKEEIVMPPEPEPEQQQEESQEPPVEEQAPEDQEDPSDDELEQEPTEEEEAAKEDKEEEKEKEEKEEEKPKPNLMFKPNDKMASLLQRLINPK